MPPPPSPQRAKKLRTVVDQRQLNWTVVLENVHDWHNISAVMRTCDAVGIQHLFILQTEEELKFKKFKLGQKSSGGNAKWLAVHYYQERKACFDHLREIVDKVYATHLAKDSIGLYQLDQSKPVALLFGNEHDGVSPETLAFCDGNFTIPMHGMTQSLNISVACAVSLFEGLRQREAAGLYDQNTSADQATFDHLFEEYKARHERGTIKSIHPVGTIIPERVLNLPDKK